MKVTWHESSAPHVFAPNKNKALRKDADEFKVEARRFLAHHEQLDTLHEIDNDLSELLQEGMVMKIIEDMSVIPGDIVFFCHGFKNRIQFGFRGVSGARRLASHIAKKHGKNRMLRCVFYCCSVAQDEDNWFNWFCDELERHNVHYWAVGHSTSGHTSKNPYVKYRGSTGAYSGSAYLVRPKCPRWGDWIDSLKTEHRFEYPWEQIDDTTDRIGTVGLPS